MEGLDFGTEAILDENEIDSLFGESEDENTPSNDNENENENDGDEKNKDNNKEKETAEVDPESIFEGEPESVGSEDHKGDEEDTTSAKGGTSPNFFSSIANACAEEGIFPDLDEDTIKNIKTAQDLRNAVDEQIRAGLDEQQKRIADALNNDVEPSKIRQYEGLLSYLENISDDDISDEGEQGEDLRKRILFQDYMNRGFSKERAEKMVNKAISDGTDIDDAKEALESNKAYYSNQYKKLLDDAKAEKEEEEKEYKAKAERIKKNVLEGNMKLFEDVDLSSKVRQTAYDAISKPIYRDPETGDTYTAVQKYEHDNSEEFLAKLGIIYALTDGFKTIDGLVKTKVKKEVKRGFSDLENRINTTTRDSRGNLKFTSGVSDTESILGKGVKLDF